jgi:hypothetical protein
VFVNLDDQDWWISNNAQFISWDLGEVESHITLNLQPYQIAFDMWNYLKTVYHLKDDARGFQHEHDLQEYICRGWYSVQDYYSGFIHMHLLNMIMSP